MSEQQRMRFQFHLMKIIIQIQAIHHPNQRHHLLKHLHYQINALMIMKKHHRKKPILDHGYKKEVLETIKKIYFDCGGDENYEHLYILPANWIDVLKYESISDEIYENLKMPAVRQLRFFVEENYDNWHPKTHLPRNYLQSFYLAALIQKCGEISIIHLQSFVLLFQEKGQDHLIKKVIIMEIICHLLIMKRNPNLRKVSEQISMPNSTHV